MSQNISDLGDVTTITPAQDAALAKANDLIDMGLPMAYEYRGHSIQFIYNDLDGDESDLRLMLDADGTFIDLQMWGNEQPRSELVGSFDDDWFSIDGGDVGERVQAAIKA